MGKPTEVGHFVVGSFGSSQPVRTVTDEELTRKWARLTLKPRWQVDLSDGTTVRVLDGRGTRSYGCYDQLNARAITSDSSGKYTEEYRLLYVLPKPVRYQTKERCLDGPDFVTRIVMLSGQLSDFDGTTFLMADPLLGLVIRFDGRLHSKSKLLGSDLFVVPEEAFQRVLERFGDDELQAIHDALFKITTSMRKSRSR